MKFLPVILAFVLLMHAPANCDRKDVSNIQKEISRHDQDLKSIRKKLEAGKKKLKQLKKEEKNVLRQLDQIDANLILTRRLIRSLAGKEKALNGEIKNLGFQLDTLRDSLQIRKQKMRKRLRVIYKQGKPGFLEAFLAAPSLAEGFERDRFFKELNAYDRRLLRSLKETKDRVEQKKAELERKREEIISVRLEKENEKQEFDAQKEDRNGMLKEIKSKRETYEQLVRELEASQKAIMDLVLALEAEKKKLSKSEKEKRKREQKVFREKFKGKMMWPTNGEVLRRFGKHKHKEYKTTTVNLGIDIKAPEGQSVLSVSDGSVIYIGNMRGYGNFIMVEHKGSYYSIYAHLQEILVEKGQAVELGQLIGRVGDTGSFEGSKLHFEFRKGKEVLDPEEWLPGR